jgi:transposase-like protein
LSLKRFHISEIWGVQEYAGWQGSPGDDTHFRTNPYPYPWWVDGIHTGLRSENSDGQCLLVIIGVRPDGRKERVAIGDGYRESKASWQELLLDLKSRGLQAGPLLAVGDGAMGFWAALEEVFPTTRAQRCWFHKMGNVLNALPKSQQGRAKADLQAIWMAATRADAHAAFDRFVTVYAAI